MVVRRACAASLPTGSGSFKWPTDEPNVFRALRRCKATRPLVRRNALSGASPSGSRGLPARARNHRHDQACRSRDRLLASGKFRHLRFTCARRRLASLRLSTDDLSDLQHRRERHEHRPRCCCKAKRSRNHRASLVMVAARSRATLAPGRPGGGALART
jgi:hypothetical protein